MDEDLTSVGQGALDISGVEELEISSNFLHNSTIASNTTFSQDVSNGQLSNHEMSQEDADSRNSSPKDFENMMVEVGNLNGSTISPAEGIPEYRAAVAHRDVVIARLSTSLQQVLAERSEDGEAATRMEEEVALLQSQVKEALTKAAKNKEFKSKYLEMKKLSDEQKTQLHLVTAQLDIKNHEVEIKTRQIVSQTHQLETSRKEVEAKKEELESKDREMKEIKNQTSKDVENLMRQLQEVQQQLAVRAKDSSAAAQQQMKSVKESAAEAEQQLVKTYEAKLAEVTRAHEEKLKEQTELHKEQKNVWQNNLNEAESRHAQEMEELSNKYEEEHVIEFNLLDAELLDLKDEKNDLEDQVKDLNEKLEYKSEKNEEFEKIETEQQNFIEQLRKDREKLSEQVAQLELMFNEEKVNKEYLEQQLHDVSSLFDETQYNLLPTPLKESISNSLRNSLSSRGQLSRRESFFGVPSSSSAPLSRRESYFGAAFASSFGHPLNETQCDADFSPAPSQLGEFSPAPNLTQLGCSSGELTRLSCFSDNEGTPTHKPRSEQGTPTQKPISQLELETDTIIALKEAHAVEMSELRKYFEGVCRELEQRYRTDVEERSRSLSGNSTDRDRGQDIVPLVSRGLDLSGLESVSPRSVDSYLKDCSGSGQESERSQRGVAGDYRGEGVAMGWRDRGEWSDKEEAGEGMNMTSLSARHEMDLENLRESHDREMQKLQAEHSDELNKVRFEMQQDKNKFNKVCQELSGKVSDESGNIHVFEKASEELINAKLQISELEKKLQVSNDEHEKEIEIVKINVRKNLETEHVAKFEAVSKQIQAIHKTELDNLRCKMEQESARKVREMSLDYNSKVNAVEKALIDIQESQKLEISELVMKHEAELQSKVKKQKEELNKSKSSISDNVSKSFEGVFVSQISPEDYEALQKDLDGLEEERNHLKSMQSLMKDLITDLAHHYNLSEKQVRFLSESQQLLGLADFSLNSSRLSEVVNCRLTDLTTGSPNPLLQYLTNKNYSIEGGRGDPEDSFNQSVALDISQGPLHQSRSTPNHSIIGGNQSIISLEELSNLLNEGSFKNNSASAEEIMKELREQVQKSNASLADLCTGDIASKLAEILAAGSRPGSRTSLEALEDSGGTIKVGDNFVGEEAGRLEVEKARLEVELCSAKRRIQELESGGRNSLSRNIVISGVGEAGSEALVPVDNDNDVRERASQVLTSLAENELEETDGEVVAVLGELLTFSDQSAAIARIQVEDLTSQLEVADKQLKSTRAFLEEQAGEREAEREEWERRLLNLREEKVGWETLQVRRLSPVESGGEGGSEEGEEDNVRDLGEIELELAAAVDKIYDLRDIIRSLEGQLDVKTQSEIAHQEVVAELRVALEEAVIGHKMVLQELESLRVQSSDVEFVEHIRGLEEQLEAKTQDLKKHRAAAAHIQEIKVQLRGLEERVEQSTRELEFSVVLPGSSCDSSRDPSPLPLTVGINEKGQSYEDIGSGLSGLEVEEVGRLEAKLDGLRKAEAVAVQRVRKLEEENKQGNGRIQELEGVVGGLEEQVKELERKRESEAEEFNELRKEGEEIDAERSALQERVIAQQMKISSLESANQAARHKKGNVKNEEIEKIIEEKKAVEEILKREMVAKRLVEGEKKQKMEQLEDANKRVEELEAELEEALQRRNVVQMAEKGKGVAKKIELLEKDKSELEEVNEKLMQQLSVARAAQLAAQKTEMPALAQSLIKEKNEEIDQLTNQLSSLQDRMTSLSSLSSGATPSSNSGTWASRLQENERSTEQLRDASVSIRRMADLSLENTPASQMPRLPGSGKQQTGSCAQLETITESEEMEALTDSIRQLSSKANREALVQQLSMQTQEQLGLTGASMGTQEQQGLTSQEQLGLTAEDEQEMEDNLVLTADSHQENQTGVSSGELTGLEAVNATNKQNEERLGEMEEEIESLTNELEETVALLEKSKERVAQVEKQLEGVGEPDQVQNLWSEIKRLKEENDDRAEGMGSLHKIIADNEANFKAREGKLNQDIERFEEEAKSFKTEYDSLKMHYDDISREFSQKLQDSQTLVLKRTEEKENLEQQLHSITNEMSSLQKVVNDLTTQFKDQIKIKEMEINTTRVELNAAKHNCASMNTHNNDLENRCQELDDLVKGAKQTITSLEHQLDEKIGKIDSMQREFEGVIKGDLSENDDKSVKMGAVSVDDLTNMVQRELDLSSELDNTLLSQLLGGSVSTESFASGLGEVQRLVKKVQMDGVQVLSLSEVLFLRQHTGEKGGLLEQRRGENKELDDLETKERELARKMEVMEFRLEQEKIVAEDLRNGLDQEKRSALENMNKLGKERREKVEIHQKLAKTEQKLESVAKQLEVVKAELESKKSQLHFGSDSENEEFLNTIDAQRQQIAGLESSLRQERDNLTQLQHVLEVERGRGRSSGEMQAAMERQQRIIEELKIQLETERDGRRGLEESLVEGGDVGRLVLDDLQRDLDLEREKGRDLLMALDMEKKKYLDMFLEYEHQRRMVGGEDRTDEESLNSFSDGNRADYDRVWRARELELEKLVSELEFKLEMSERAVERGRVTEENLKTELSEERERGIAGLSQEQLGRMRQVNQFLEHNIRENGEMCRSLAKLHEERQELRQTALDLKARLQGCVCSRPASAMNTPGDDASRTQYFYRKYLRSESFRKALVWQKRYLLVVLSGGQPTPDPVFKVTPGQASHKGGRFRAAVHTVIAISRMKYLVKRWRSGKRIVAPVTSPEVKTSEATPGTPHSPRSATLPRAFKHNLSSHAPPNATSPRSTSHTAMSPRGYSERYNSGARPLSSSRSHYAETSRTNSLSRSHRARSEARPTTLPITSMHLPLTSLPPTPSLGSLSSPQLPSSRMGVTPDILSSPRRQHRGASPTPSGHSSCSSLTHPPVPHFTGLTPPTRDVQKRQETRRLRHSASTGPDLRHSASTGPDLGCNKLPPGGAQFATGTRRSLGSALEGVDANDSLQKLVPVLQDQNLQANLTEYIQRFGKLQKNLSQGKKK